MISRARSTRGGASGRLGIEACAPSRPRSATHGARGAVRARGLDQPHQAPGVVPLEDADVRAPSRCPRPPSGCCRRSGPCGTRSSRRGARPPPLGAPAASRAPRRPRTVSVSLARSARMAMKTEAMNTGISATQGRDAAGLDRDDLAAAGEETHGEERAGEGRDGEQVGQVDGGAGAARGSGSAPEQGALGLEHVRRGSAACRRPAPRGRASRSEPSEGAQEAGRHVA